MTIISSRGATVDPETPALMPSRILDKRARQEFVVGALLGTEACVDKVIEKKLFKEKRSAKAKVEKEILIHRQLDHKHIVRFLRHFEDRSSVHILLELCPSKTLLHVCRCQLNDYQRE